MRLSSSFFYTLRENVKDEDSTSGNLLVRSGMIKKASSGIYMYLPMGLKVLTKIQNIIKDEMNKAGASELLMPSLLPKEVFEKCGRVAAFGQDMFTFKDRNNRDFVLGPTHEELFVQAAMMKVRSYKDLPFTLYQSADKFRDEPRPRYGLIRVREFMMKDAYSFDKDYEGLDVSYQKMYQAYQNIFDRMGIKYKIVTADTGAMGGLLSEEFQAITDIGEDTLVLCDQCDYASNIEVSECVDRQITTEDKKPISLINTPNVGSIAAVSAFLGENPNKFVKTMIYKIDDQFYAVMIAGDREINETKVRKMINGINIELASFDETKKITNAEVGFAGPIGLTIPIIIDSEVLQMTNFIVGANKTDYHYQNTNLHDFKYDYSGDIKNITENDKCPVCGGKIYFKKGIEIGNTFKLGDKYAIGLGLNYLDKENTSQNVIMGSYGIGPGRCMAAIVEQNNDEKGLIWPLNIAPYQVGIILVNPQDETMNKIAEDLYQELTAQGIEVLLDDRDERIGVKFNDFDLIGLPIRIVVGKKASEGIIEFKKRLDNESIELPVTEVQKTIVNCLSSQK